MGDTRRHERTDGGGLRLLPGPARARPAALSRPVAVLVVLMLAAVACGPNGEGEADGGDAATEGTETAGCPEGANGGAGGTQAWDMFAYTPPQHYATVTLTEFADEVRSETDGRVDITVRPAGELPHAPGEAPSIVQQGFVQLADATGTFVEGQLPIAAAVELPFLMETQDQHMAAMEATLPHMNRALEGFNAEILFSYGYPRKVVSGADAVPSSLADLDGRRIRTLGNTDGEAIRELGMTPVSMPPGEVPVALERGVVDGSTGTWFFNVASRWFELMDWSYALNIGTITSYVYVGCDSLASLSAEDQQSLREIAATYGERMTTDLYTQEEEAGQTMEESGIEMVEPSSQDEQAATELLSDYRDQWVERVGAEGEAILADIQEAIDAAAS